MRSANQKTGTRQLTARNFIAPIIAVLLLSCAQLSNAVTKSSVAASVIRDIAYVPGSTMVSQKLDLYLPERKPDQRPKLVVFIHGGGWRFGSKDPWTDPGLAERGFAVASINYRYSQEAPFPASVYDCKAAIRWLRAHANEYGYDADHIGVWGISAGAHLAAMLGTTAGVGQLEGDLGNKDRSSKVSSVVAWAGPMDLVTIASQAGKKNQLQMHKPDNIIAQFLGGVQPTKNKGLAATASPITYVTPDDATFLLVHGDKDDIVPVQQSMQFFETLRRAQVPVTLNIVPGGNHGLQPAYLRRQVVDFFVKTLKG